MLKNATTWIDGGGYHLHYDNANYSKCSWGKLTCEIHHMATNDRQKVNEHSE